MSERSPGGDAEMAILEPNRPPEQPEPSCELIDRTAVQYFFNGLADDRRAAVRVHLDRCPRCRRKLTLFAAAWTDRRVEPDRSG
jgi:hypothetical protein